MYKWENNIFSQEVWALDIDLSFVAIEVYVFTCFLKISLNYDCILGSYEGPIQMNIILACRRITELFKM